MSKDYPAKFPISPAIMESILLDRLIRIWRWQEAIKEAEVKGVKDKPEGEVKV